jgi:hypothetical protein
METRVVRFVSQWGQFVSSPLFAFSLHMTMIMNTVAHSISSNRGSYSFHVCTTHSQNSVTPKLMSDCFLYNNLEAREFRISCILLTKKFRAALTVLSFGTIQIDRATNNFEWSKWYPWLSNQRVLCTKSPTEVSFEIFSSFMIVFKSHSTLFDLSSCSKIDKFRENHWEKLDPRLSLGTSNTEVLDPYWLQRETKGPAPS